MAFWIKIEASAQLLRIPHSIIFVRRFLEEDPKLLANFLAASAKYDLSLSFDLLERLSSFFYVSDHYNTLMVAEAASTTNSKKVCSEKRKINI